MTSNSLDLASVTWRKSSRSGGANNCVELADAAPAVAVRDSKHPAQPALAVGRTTWSAFARSTRSGGFDLA